MVSKYYQNDGNYLQGGAVFRAPAGLKRMMHVYGTISVKSISRSCLFQNY